jgi:hypothetical protein
MTSVLAARQTAGTIQLWRSTLRFVPRPCYADAIVIGVFVVDEGSNTFAVRLADDLVTNALRARPTIDPVAIPQLVEALLTALDIPARPGQTVVVKSSDALQRLRSYAEYLSNQLQLTVPEPTEAQSIEAALAEFVRAPAGV